MANSIENRPVVLCIMDGVGLGRADDGNAVWAAETPVLDELVNSDTHRALIAHGPPVGLPSLSDMGNSEVGHNAIGAGRTFSQGAALVDSALKSESAFQGDSWPWLLSGGTLHLLGLLSDGNVHAHTQHLFAILQRAAKDGVKTIRIHLLTDGRDVGERTALEFIQPLEELLKSLSSSSRDYAIASGGGRMNLTMDRYDADWAMVERGWNCHVHGQGRQFSSASIAIQTLYDEDPQLTDQWLPPFVITNKERQPIGRISNGDGVLFWNFRGDRSIEISKAFEGRDVPFNRGSTTQVRFAGMMQYDGDQQIPNRFLVSPPAIESTVGEHLVAARQKIFAISETQKFGHVTYFFNGNRSGYLDPSLEVYEEIPSDRVPFNQAPGMQARAITKRTCEAITSGSFNHIRLNLPNGDMVGHTGDFDATVLAMEVVDRCLGDLRAAIEQVGGVLLVTADHGNAEQMYEWDKKNQEYKRGKHGERITKTSHSLNPIPFAVVDPMNRWCLTDVEDPNLTHIGSTLLTLAGIELPRGYVPSLLEPLT
ncbi:MAG: 2,3-bisphosphoglycerate-independent phosphoglycerate mutase [Myxococcota bacterium]|nr:2,3-bisphosphoglycerate-independent phosphoglycerate mutase [Myxococcota bacterium]